MLKHLISSTAAPPLSRLYSSTLRVTLVLCQRGGFQGRGGGHRGDGGGRASFRPQQHSPQRSGYRNQEAARGSYGGAERRGDSRGERYDDNSQRYGSRQQGHMRRPHGYSDRPPEPDRRGGHYDRPRGHGNRPHEYQDHQPAPRKTREQYLEGDVEKLLQLRHEFKTNKNTKERSLAKREARRVLRQVRIDPSSQDEKSIAVVLNSAAFFASSNEVDAVSQGFQWMLQNIRGISPQNVALLANAIGVLHPDDAQRMMLDTVAPVVASVMREMTTVEVVMVIQAFRRLRIEEAAALQDNLVLQLEPCISSMPVQQLSTLATALQNHPLKERDEDKWRRITQATLSRALTNAEKMHSREAIVLLEAAPFINASQEQLCQLLARTTETASFHTDEQVGTLLRALVKIRQTVVDPGVELASALDALQKALLVRLEKVSPFVRAKSAQYIWRYTHLAQIELPQQIQKMICDQLLLFMTYRRIYLSALSKLMMAASTQKHLTSEFLTAVTVVAIGERLPRPDKRDATEAEGACGDEDDFEDVREAAREARFSRCFGDLVQLRISLEDAFARNGVPPNEVLTTTLPKNLTEQLAGASAVQLLNGVAAIATAPSDCPLRNTAHDDAVLSHAAKIIANEPEKFKAELSPKSAQWFYTQMTGRTKGATVVEALQRALAD